MSVLWVVREGNGFSSLVGGAEAASLLLGQGVELLRHFPSHSVVALVGTGAPALWGSKPKCYWLVMMAQLMIMLAELFLPTPPPPPPPLHQGMQPTWTGLGPVPSKSLLSGPPYLCSFRIAWSYQLQAPVKEAFHTPHVLTHSLLFSPQLYCELFSNDSHIPLAIV